MAEYAILRFAKHKAGPAGALEAHHERTKEKYASNPDINIARSKDNFHIIKPDKWYRQEIDARIEAADCKTRKDSTMFVDPLITASPEFFEGRKKAEVKAFFAKRLLLWKRRLAKAISFPLRYIWMKRRPIFISALLPLWKMDGYRQKRY